MSNWRELYITDKSGCKYFNTVASPMSAASEARNLTQHLKQAAKYPGQYKFLDIETAVVMFDGEPYGQVKNEVTNDDLLKELGL